MFRSVAAFLLALTLLSGCAGGPTMKISPEALNALSGRTIVGADSSAPAFMHMTPAHGMFGGAGYILSASQADEFTRANGIVDPSPGIETRVKATLARLGSGQEGASVSLASTGGKVIYPKLPATLIVDARTTDWQYIYLPFDWGRYQVLYRSHTQLIDGETGNVKGEHHCFLRSPEDGKGAPTEPELLLNGSALLNSTLAKLADQCAAQFEKEVLNVGGQ